MKKIFALSLMLLLVLALCACGGKTADVTIDYGTSELYTTAEMDDAIAAIKQEFARMEGCELHSLTYAGDERSLSELDYCKEIDAVEYVDCMIFDSSFRSPKDGGGAWEADTEYTWNWILAREEGGNWVLVTYGYGSPVSAY